MRVTKYDVFLRAADSGSLTATAEFFGYTQSAVTQIINAMEKEFGCPLFIRSRKGAALTAEGQALYPRIQEIVNSLRSLNEQISDITGMMTGTVRIASVTSISCCWLPSLITGFRKQYPDIQFDITLGTYEILEELIQSGKADIAFSRRPERKTSDFIPLKKDPMRVIIPPDHPAASSDVFLSHLLGDDPFISVIGGDSDITDRMFSDYRLTPDVRYRVTDDYTIMAMVESGMGISILPELVMKRTSYKILIKKTVPSYYRILGLCMRDRRALSPATERFVKFVEAQKF